MSFNSIIAQEGYTVTWDEEVGCRDYLIREQASNPDISIPDDDCIFVCSNNSVIYSVSGNTSNISSVAWEVTGGDIQNTSGFNANILWGDTGLGSVKAIITNNDGEIDTQTICIVKAISPRADFKIGSEYNEDTYLMCLDNDLYFTDLSSDNNSSPIVSYLWDFGDGNFSTEANPVHNYINPGEYTVFLTVTNNCGCSDTIKKQVFIEEKKAFPIECPSIVCFNEVASYSVPNDLYSYCNGNLEWEVVGGTVIFSEFTMVNVLWNDGVKLQENGGFGFVTVKTGNCDSICEGDITIKVPVILDRTDIIGENQICTNQSNLYEIPQWPTTEVTWNVIGNDSGTSIIQTEQRNRISFKALNPGTYSLRADYKNTLVGCDGYATITIVVKDNISIIGEETLCFTPGQSTVSNYEIEDAENIQNNENIVWYLKKPNNSTQNLGTGTSKNITFSSPGEYIISNGDGVCGTNSFVVNVLAPESAPNINNNSLPEDNKICFDVSYEIQSANDEELYWAIENGTFIGPNIGTSVTVQFTESSSGDYTVRAWSKMDTAPYCDSELTSISFTPEVVDLEIEGEIDVCSSTSYEYTNLINGTNLSYENGDIYTWSLENSNLGNFEDGNTNSSVNILWNNVSSTENTILKLEVERCGVVYEFEKEITIYPGPEFEIVNISDICVNESNSFQITGISTGNIVWDFGNGDTITTSTPNVLYTYPETNGDNTEYTISVTVTDPDNCIGTTTKTMDVSVFGAPKATITPYDNLVACEISEITDYTLTVNTEQNLADITEIEWYHDTDSDFSNGGYTLLSSSTSITSEINQFGFYYSRLKNNNECWSITNIVHIKQKCDDEDASGSCTTHDGDIDISLTKDGCNQIIASALPIGSNMPITTSWTTTATNELTLISSTPTTAIYQANTPGVHSIYNEAIYGGTLCNISSFSQIIIPYIADLKYSVECAQDQNGYQVTLFDASNTMPNATDFTYQFFEVNSGTSTPITPVSTNAEHSLVLQPGTHTFEIEIIGSFDGVVQAPCRASVVVNLPELPNANFDISSTEVCENDPVSITLEGSIDPESTYLWILPNGEENSATVPTISTTGTYGPKQISLTVTNKYGCTSTFSKGIVINKNNLDGSVKASPDIACKGENIILQYEEDLDTDTPTNYYWMYNGEQIAETTDPFLGDIPEEEGIVTKSGYYWVKVSDDSSTCTTSISEGTNISFSNSPSVRIQGKPAICEDEDITLKASVQGDNYLFIWSKNGTQISTNPEIELNNLNPGTYNYQLETKIPDGNGGYCTQYDTHSLTVVPLPSPMQLNFSVVKCENPYTVKIVASGDDNGFYTWSNGMTGNEIQVHEGGVYQVRFKNFTGCEITEEIDIPHSIESYSWIVPQGCYDMCGVRGNTPGDPYLVGPTDTFESWKWITNNGSPAGGEGFPEDININQSGNYGLYLENNDCQETIEGPSINLEPCKCDLRISTSNYAESSYYEGYCSYNINIGIPNDFNEPMSVTLQTEVEGVTIIPSSFYINGNSTLNSSYSIYVNADTPISEINILYESTVFIIPEPEICIVQKEIILGECVAEARKSSESSSTVLNQEETLNNISIAPNPAQDFVNIHFEFANSNYSQKSIEIYNMQGQLISNRKLDIKNGTIQLDVSPYQSGLYLVLLKENERILKREKLKIN
ncbi:PKD domain-containing protein [Aureivirga sp. CE67]|uniref:PKD domain-containing protein n=1 Tax=Aureivirga sp. CE67 TaxID=1788983 RepID=UPI00293D824A|nr:PKD domain-containing protein [Aureivirga sp. CE67]